MCYFVVFEYFRGVYLACLLYTEDKILVSTEENIPTVEVDETYPSSLHTDMLWMMKVSFD